MYLAFDSSRSGNVLRRSMICAIVGLCLAIANVDAQPVPPGSPLVPIHGDYQCLTQILYDWKYGRPKADLPCPQEGLCDTPRVRDRWIPEPDGPITTVALVFHIIAGESGGGPALTVEDLADAVDSLNADFLPYRIQFRYQYRIISSAQFRMLESWDEANLMKEMYALDPAYQCNIFITDVYIDGWSFSWGTYPWEPGAEGPLGGIFLTGTHVPPFDYGTLTHEMGHALGLYHTFRGSEEEELCDACYESPQQPNNDWVGDLCSDTDPSPENYSCQPPGGEDPCTHIEWGPTQPANHMAYTPLWCRHEFSPQQAGRMHCWLRDRMDGWIETVHLEADITSGPAPLEVQFTSETPEDVQNWLWDLGDGTSAGVPHPRHTYTDPGLYDLSVTFETPGDTCTRTWSECIWVYADTLIVPAVWARVDESVRFDIYARNTQPLDRIRMPFDWSGELNLSLDSVSTAGLRTAPVTSQRFVHFDPLNKRATYEIDPGPGNPLPPDTGAVLSLYFTNPSGQHGQITPVSILSYDGYEPLFSCARGAVVPILRPGQLVVCRAGDVNNDGKGPNITDLTYLVQFLFRGGPEPPLAATANVNGILPVNIADITYLVKFIFESGPPPLCL